MGSLGRVAALVGVGAWLSGCGAGDAAPSDVVLWTNWQVVSPAGRDALPPALRARARRWPGFAAARSDGERLLAVRGGWRRGVVLTSGERYEARIALPNPESTGRAERARFTFSCALNAGRVPEGCALRVASRAPSRAYDEAVELARVPAAPDWLERWRTITIDLGAEAAIEPGAERVLSVELAAPGPHLVAVAEPTVFVPTDDAPTVVLVTSDTHRGDHVELRAGEALVRTPALRALAERGVAFTDAFASSNITVPSHAALMTGLTPKETGVLDNATALAARAHTLAEHFAAAGWATYAATSTSLLDDDNAGLGQGFDRLSSPRSDDPAQRTRSRRPARETLAVLESWWPDAAGRPLFVWLHVFDAHSPYSAPEAIVAEYWPADRDPADPTLPEPPARRIPEWAVGVRDLDYLRARYRAGASWVDRSLAQVLDRERVRRGVVAVTSDHGENLGEHDIWWTHKDVYRQTLHVPLVLAGPGVPRGRLDARPVRMIDLGRTLLDLAGLEAVEHPGTNLLAPESPDAPRFAVSGRLRSASVAHDGWLLVKRLVDHRLGRRGREVEAGEVELFDLTRDPDGLVDRAADEPERRRALEARLDAWLAEPAGSLAGTTRTDEETLRTLRELGYVDGDE